MPKLPATEGSLNSIVVLAIGLVLIVVMLWELIPDFSENSRLNSIASQLEDSPELKQRYGPEIEVTRVSSGVQGATVYSSRHHKESLFRILLPNRDTVQIRVKWVSSGDGREIKIDAFSELNEDLWIPISKLAVKREKQHHD